MCSFSINLSGGIMRIISRFFIFVFTISLLYFGCQSKSPEANFSQFNQIFFAQHVPEFPGARLLTKTDIPKNQQEFFDEEDGQLQLLLDMNNNSILEYIICGVSDSMLQQNEKSPYFITMFEKTDVGIVRQHIQPLNIVPVNIQPSQERHGVIISFAFNSEFAAEIYFENNQYHLYRWFN